MFAKLHPVNLNENKSFVNQKTLAAASPLPMMTIAYNFGHYPVQQYLIDIGKGRLGQPRKWAGWRALVTSQA